MHKVTVSPSPRRSLQLDLHKGLPRLEVLLSKQIVDGAWVMSYWVVEILAFFISFLEISEQGSQFLPEQRRKLPYLLKHFLSNQNTMSHFQRHHCDGNLTVKHYRCCLRIHQNVKLGCWAPVPQSNCSPHYCYSIDLLSNVWKSIQNNGQIRHGPSDHELHASILSHDLVVYIKKRLFLNGLFGRFEQLSSLKSTFPMDLWGDFKFTAQWLR